jgi:hypothetical protein
MKTGRTKQGVREIPHLRHLPQRCICNGYQSHRADTSDAAFAAALHLQRFPPRVG